MQLTQAEILTNLSLTCQSPARAVVNLSKLELSDTNLVKLFRNFAGEDAALPESNITETVVSYLVYDAARGIAVDVSGAIDRAKRLAASLPGTFTEGAKRERAVMQERERVEREAERLKYIGKLPAELKADAVGVVPAMPTADAPLMAEPKRRGRQKAAPGESTYDRALAMYNAADDKSRDVLVPLMAEALGCAPGSAMVYWYKAKKEVGVAMTPEV